MTPQEELAELEELERLEAQAPKRAAAPEEVAKPEGGFLEGIGSGMVRGARGATNLLYKAMNAMPGAQIERAFTGQDRYQTPEFASDQTIRDQDELDKPLGETGAGMAGQVVGNIAATLPLTLATGGLGGASTAGSAGIRALGHPATRAGIEGAVGGAMYGDPDSMGEDAAQGALLSATLNRLGAAGGKLLKGLVTKSDAAKELEHIAGQQGERLSLPLAQAAGEDDFISRMTKGFYREALPLIPGTRGKLQRQGEEALEQVREVALRDAAPDGVTIARGDGRRVGEAVRKIKEGFDEGYEKTAKSFDFITPTDFGATIEQRVRAAMPDVDDTTATKVAKDAERLLARFSSGKDRIEGSNLLNVKNEISKLIKMAPGFEKGAYQEVVDEINELISRRLGPQGLKQASDDLVEPYRIFKGVQKAAHGARSKYGNFSMAQLANAAKDPSQLHMAQVGNEVTGSPVINTSIAGKVMAGIANLGAGFGAYMDPMSAGLAIGGGHVLSSKGAQRALMGDTASQRAIAKLLRENPELARMVGAGARMGAATQVGGE